MPNNYYLYINSKNRDQKESVHNFNVYLTNQLNIGKNQGLNVSVVGFSMLNSMYNINATNNSYELEERDLITNNLISISTFSIASGNYNAFGIRDFLKAQLTGKVDITYITSTSAYTYKKLTADRKLFLTPINSHKIFGLNQRTEITTAGTIGTFINLVNYSQLIIKCPSLNFEDCVQDNINPSKEMGGSSILFMIDKQDVSPFHMITYKNEDGNNNYNYNIRNQVLWSLNLQLFNENNEFITDASDYFLTLKFTIFERYEPIFKELGIQSLSLLDDIHFTLLNILFKRKNNILL